MMRRWKMTVTRRAVEEWIGKTPDTPAPARVRLRVFDRCGGICHLSGRKIQPGDKWDMDHITALVNGGENRESNLAPALKEEHRKKTASDVAMKAKVDRVRKKHLGIEPKKAKVGGALALKFKKMPDGRVVPR